MTCIPICIPRFLPSLLLMTAAATASAQSTTRVSVDSAGVEGNEASFSYNSAVSADGRFVAFVSDASNLVAGDTNGHMDAFVHDRSTGVTTRVSVDSSGAEVGNSSSIYGVAISADGQTVAFASDGSTLVANDTNTCFDVFVHDLATGITERVSIDSSGVEGSSDSMFPLISADGQVVAFEGYDSNLDPTDANSRADVYVHDRGTGITQRVSKGLLGADARDYCRLAAISGDGNVVAFDSHADNLISGDTNGASDIFVHDRTTGITERVNVDSSGGQTIGDSEDAALSADGQIVAFTSWAQQLVPGDTNGGGDVFVHDRSTGVTERVSVDSSGGQGDGDSTRPAISADGVVVAFRSDATNLVPNDLNGVRDVFFHDRANGITGRASVDSSGAEGDANSYNPSISADGRSVAYYSFATNLVAADGNGYYDIFVHGLCADASWSNYGVGFAGANGVPAFTSQDDPVLGASVTLDLGSSASSASVAYVIFGFAETFVPTGKGGDLLVAPSFALVLALPTTGTTIAGTLPDDEAACGFELFAQALELDPGAVRGVSFTAGLKLVCGR